MSHRTPFGPPSTARRIVWSGTTSSLECIQFAPPKWMVVAADMTMQIRNIFKPSEYYNETLSTTDANFIRYIKPVYYADKWQLLYGYTTRQWSSPYNYYSLVLKLVDPETRAKTTVYSHSNFAVTGTGTETYNMSTMGFDPVSGWGVVLYGLPGVYTGAVKFKLDGTTASITGIPTWNTHIPEDMALMQRLSPTPNVMEIMTCGYTNSYRGYITLSGTSWTARSGGNPDTVRSFAFIGNGLHNRETGPDATRTTFYNADESKSWNLYDGTYNNPAENFYLGSDADGNMYVVCSVVAGVNPPLWKLHAAGTTVTKLANLDVNSGTPFFSQLNQEVITRSPTSGPGGVIFFRTTDNWYVWFLTLSESI